MEELQEEDEKTPSGINLKKIPMVAFKESLKENTKASTVLLGIGQEKAEKIPTVAKNNEEAVAKKDRKLTIRRRAEKREERKR